MRCTFQAVLPTRYGLAVHRLGIALLTLVGGPRPGHGKEDPVRPAPRYAGAKACMKCHDEIHAEWLTASHTRTFEPATAENMPPEVLAEKTVKHAPGQSRFFRKDGRFFVETL